MGREQPASGYQTRQFDAFAKTTSPPMRRFSFARVGKTLLAFLIASLWSLENCRSAEQPLSTTNYIRFEFTEQHLAVDVSLKFYASSEPEAIASARFTFERIDALNAVLSDYDAESEVNTVLARAGREETVPISQDLLMVLDASLRLAEQSNGAFDPTVAPLVRLWRRARRTGTLPDSEVRKKAQALVGFRHVHLDRGGSRLGLSQPGVQLDFGGIAKGYVASEAVKALAARGHCRALVAVAGDIAAGEPPLGDKDSPVTKEPSAGWRVGIVSLDNQGKLGTAHQFVRLTNHAISTSGDAFQYAEIDGVRYSHIVSPATGLGLSQHSLTTVIAKEGLVADGVATALSILNETDGRSLLALYPDAEARVYFETASGVGVWESAGFQRYIEPDSSSGSKRQ